ncbi:MAG: hypothetical protein ACR2QM_01675 [Longimicrobiales bacterium]
MSQTPPAMWSKALIAVCLTGILACQEAGDLPAEPELFPDDLDAAFDGGSWKGRSVSYVDLVTYPTQDAVWGKVRVVRSDRGVRFNMRTTGLNPKHAYTIWMGVYNNPDGWTSPRPDGGKCDGPDLFNDGAKPDMMWMAGKVARGGEYVTFRGRKRVGSNYGTVEAPVGLPSYGLTNPHGAELFFVVHDHGPKIRKYMPDMVRSIDGGCYDAGTPFAGRDDSGNPNEWAGTPWNVGPAGPTKLPGYGRRGPNTCQGVQIAFSNPGEQK